MIYIFIKLKLKLIIFNNSLTLRLILFNSSRYEHFMHK